MPATRVLPTEEAADLLRLTREIVEGELAPRVAQAEADEVFPREVFRPLGRTGSAVAALPRGVRRRRAALRGLPPGARGDRAVWSSVGVGVSVHALSCFGLFTRGTEEQKQRLLPDMLCGELLGAYACPEPHAGSDPAAMTTTARPRGRRVRALRHEGLDHPRRARRLLQGDGPDLGGPQRASPASSSPRTPRVSAPTRPSARWA